MTHVEKRHKKLSELLQIEDDSSVSKTFTALIAIVDPMSQPMESDEYVISIELLSDLLISLRFSKHSAIPEFDLATDLFHILENSLKLLKCHDEVKLRKLNNSDSKVNWRLRLNEWIPNGIDDQDLDLIYMIDSVALYTIYKLYAFNNPDICLNPFLGFYLKLWKILTHVVLLGLEIDRRLEVIPDQSTPSIVKKVIRGSSAVRYVLASILNDDITNRYHDFNHVNIVDFLSPYGRRNGTGALHADVRWYIGAMLALGTELNEVVEVLLDLEPNDRYDEDIRYMFDFEYDDHHHEILYPEDYDEDGYYLGEEPNIYKDIEGNFHKVVIKRCTCQFFDEEIPDDDEDDLKQINSAGTAGANLDTDKPGMPTAVRSNEDNIEFDELGRDWRDVPREGNIFFNSKAKLDESSTYSLTDLTALFNEMSNQPVSDEKVQKALFTIARAVKLEFENEVDKSITIKSVEVVDKDVVTPDKIYESWSYDWDSFEPILALNPEAAYSMLDEMFMAHGYRRVLIWFITHLALSFSLINYIFELVTGIRGETKERNMRFIFSRQGPLVLSEIEKSMLLHEFLNNCLIYLSKSSEEGDATSNANIMNRNIKIVKLICMMIKRLIEKEMIDLDEYKIELTSLLINWIGIVPEAKALFFHITSNTSHEYDLDEFETSILLDGDLHKTPQGQRNRHIKITSPSKPTLKKVQKRTRKFNKELKIALGNVIKKLDSGALLFKSFFELIEHDSILSEKDDQDDIKSSHLLGEDSNTFEPPKYIKGDLRKLRIDEEAEHEKIQESIDFD